MLVNSSHKSAHQIMKIIPSNPDHFPDSSSGVSPAAALNLTTMISESHGIPTIILGI
jgi:dihydropteroate synthase